MIELSNGRHFEYCCASGALGFIGDSKYLGYWWEQPLHAMGFIEPQNLVLITKTLTFEPRVGNLKWWCPWRCVRPLGGGNFVNAVGLTNPGYRWWISNCYSQCMAKSYSVIVSIAPQTIDEAMQMAIILDECRGLVGIEVNVSCPNVEHDSGVEHICKLVRAVTAWTSLPVIVKLNYLDPYPEICEELDDGSIDAFDLINTVKFSHVYPGRKSPLAKYGLEGGVSGPAIRPYARLALKTVKEMDIRTPIITGGGLDYQEMRERDGLADAFAFGTIFLRRPWQPRQYPGRHMRAKYREMNQHG